MWYKGFLKLFFKKKKAMEGTSDAHVMSRTEATELLVKYGLKPESRAEVCARPGHNGDPELQAWLERVNSAVKVLHQ